LCDTSSSIGKRDMKRTIQLCLMVALAGCVTPPQGIKVQTVTVNIPVAVACIDKAKLPIAPTGPVALSGRADQDIGPITAQAMRWRSVALDLFALAGPCMK
jgi:hypothetical protein